MDTNFQSAFHRRQWTATPGIEDRRVPRPTISFSPLFIAAATKSGCYDRAQLSVRFSSRQWLLHRSVLVATKLDIDNFQSAFHRGNGCYQAQAIESIALARKLSVRFSSRQWLLLCAGRCGRSLRLSPSSGHGLLRYSSPPVLRGYAFQSAFHRGNGCYYSADFRSPTTPPIEETFSPLFIAAMVATQNFGI